MEKNIFIKHLKKLEKAILKKDNEEAKFLIGSFEHYSFRCFPEEFKKISYLIFQKSSIDVMKCFFQIDFSSSKNYLVEILYEEINKKDINTIDLIFDILKKGGGSQCKQQELIYFGLIYCCKNDIKDIFDYLIKKEGSFISHKDNFAFRTAVKQKNYYMIEKLLNDKRVNPSSMKSRAVLVAFQQKDYKMINFLLNDLNILSNLKENNAELYQKVIISKNLKSF